MGKTTFTDTKGREWALRISIGAAMRLRDEAGVDVDKILDEKTSPLQSLIEDPIKLVAALEILVEEQRERLKIERVDFLNAIDGSVLDEALESFLFAIAASLGKLKRRALEAAIPKVTTGLDDLATKIEAKIQAINL